MNSFKKTDIYKAYMKSPYRSIKHLSYFHTYPELLESYRNKKITFVEIGVLDGGSLFMWREFFGPKARIIGVEFNPDAKRWEKDGFEIYIGSQSDKKFWDRFFKKIGSVDIILDDGGHTNEQQIVTAYKTIPHIKDGGMLIVEDTHASYMTRFGNPSSVSFIEWCKSLIDNINSRFPNIHQSRLPYKNHVSSIQFYESIVCFHIDRTKCIVNKSITNKGITVGARDYRYKGIFLEKIRIKSRWISWIYLKIKEQKLRKYF